MFAMKVERGDALIFDGSLPHGQGEIPEDEDTWSLFVTLHEPGTFAKGFPNASINQSISIYRALTKEDQGWDKGCLQHFYDHPLLLQQVSLQHIDFDSPGRYSFCGIVKSGTRVGKTVHPPMITQNLPSYSRTMVFLFV